MQPRQTTWTKLIKEHQVLILMLFLALVMGIIFIFLVPPWQHYDEPTQFEYAWLIANQPGVPDTGEYDQLMRREVAASMVEHGFFRDLGFEPNLLSTTEPIWLGISQVGSKPIYYWLAALPIRLLRTSDVTLQLYTVRFVSLFFYLLMVVIAYGFAVELTHPKHPLRWLLPVSILLLPGFVDILTAVNDDVAATAFFSLYLWVGVRLIKRGFNWFRFLALVSLSALCFYTKSTVMIAVVLLWIPVLFSVVPKGKQRYTWLAIGLGAVIMLILLFDRSGAGSWYPETSEASISRVAAEETPAGAHALAIHLDEDTPRSTISQLVLPVETKPVGKTPFTVGAWIWADLPLTVQAPVLGLADQNLTRQVEASREPRFYAYTEYLGPGEKPYKVSLTSVQGPIGEPVTIYYDGIILTQGDYSGDGTPHLDDAQDASGVWGDQQFTNLLRNHSIESPSFLLRDWVAGNLSRLIQGNPNLIMGLIQDPHPLIPYYKLTLRSLLHTFWARFGWAQVFLVGHRPYTMLAILTLVGLVCAMFAFWRKRRVIRWDIFFFLGLALAAVWIQTIFRGLTSIINGGLYVPVARYTYPVILPTMLILDVGWLEIANLFEKYLKVPQKYLQWVVVGSLLILDLLSVYSIYTFYRA